MTISEVQAEILRLKREREICILAHIYQAREIIEVADYTGDSYGLSVNAASDTRKTIVFCGVRFMGETAKLLSPEKTVYMANPEAGCPMADELSAERLKKAIAENPGYKVVCYMNTTAEVKALSDVCVTSSSAVKILGAMPERDFLFVPDCNLGAYVASKLPSKNIKLIEGGCPIHAAMTLEDVKAAKEKHPEALLLVHPECRPEVSREADYVGSTTGIFDFAVASDKTEFIIGTEGSVASHLQYACPEKSFYPLSRMLVCHDMKLTSLMDLYRVIKDGGEEITMPPELMTKARKCISEMIRLGG